MGARVCSLVPVTACVYVQTSTGREDGNVADNTSTSAGGGNSSCRLLKPTAGETLTSPSLPFPRGNQHVCIVCTSRCCTQLLAGHCDQWEALNDERNYCVLTCPNLTLSVSLSLCVSLSLSPSLGGKSSVPAVTSSIKGGRATHHFVSRDN